MESNPLLDALGLAAKLERRTRMRSPESFIHVAVPLLLHGASGGVPRLDDNLLSILAKQVARQAFPDVHVTFYDFGDLPTDESWIRAYRAERQFQAHAFRDIFGNPFRPVTADPSWLTSTAVALAQAIYADRAFDRLPILADALEEAGCDEPAVLSHCRSDGPHVPGCWVVDLVLGKE